MPNFLPRRMPFTGSRHNHNLLLAVTYWPSLSIKTTVWIKVNSQNVLLLKKEKFLSHKKGVLAVSVLAAMRTDQTGIHDIFIKLDYNYEIIIIIVIESLVTFDRMLTNTFRSSYNRTHIIYKYSNGIAQF